MMSLVIILNCIKNIVNFLDRAGGIIITCYSSYLILRKFPHFWRKLIFVPLADAANKMYEASNRGVDELGDDFCTNVDGRQPNENNVHPRTYVYTLGIIQFSLPDPQRVNQNPILSLYGQRPPSNNMERIPEEDIRNGRVSGDGRDLRRDNEVILRNISVKRSELKHAIKTSIESGDLFVRV